MTGLEPARWPYSMKSDETMLISVSKLQTLRYLQALHQLPWHSSHIPRMTAQFNAKCSEEKDLPSVRTEMLKYWGFRVLRWPGDMIFEATVQIRASDCGQSCARASDLAGIRKAANRKAIEFAFLSCDWS